MQSPRIRDILASTQAQSSRIRDLHLHVLALGNVSFTCQWLILRAWHHTPQAFLETSSQAGHILLENGTTRSDDDTGNSVPYLIDSPVF